MRKSVFPLFAENGRQLPPEGMARTRLYKAIKLVKKVWEALEIKWVPFTRQQLRPTALTATDKKQTADYIRHEAETATAATLPLFDSDLFRRINGALLLR